MGERTLLRLDPGVPRPDFSCGDDDLDEFFHVDSIQGGEELIAVTYLFVEDEKPLTFFSLSNDAIRRKEVPGSIRKRLLKPIPQKKRYRTMPAAKIGRLGVSKDIQSKGEGTFALDYIKYWFVTNNKTGCRFLLVDAYNNEKGINFYAKNGFLHLTEEDKDDDTRIMYLDLITYRE